MALGFGRKKAADDAATPPEAAESTPLVVAPTTEENTGAEDTFDLDAFATQLEAGAAPQTSLDADFAPSATGSAFDFPEPSHAPVVESASESQTLDFNETFAAEQRDAIASGKIAPAPPAEIEAPPETGLYAPQVAVETPKKKLPLAPIIGAVLALGVAGAAASFLTRDNAEEEFTSARSASAPPAPAPRQVSPRQAAPAPVASSNTNVTPPRPAPNTAPQQLSPEMKTRLKALWKQGADAKHRGDYKAARRIWQQGLQVQPGNRGFIESIAKLPK